MLENLLSAAAILIVLAIYFFFRKLVKLEQTINELNSNFNFHQNFFIEYEKDKNKKFKENEKKNKFRTYYPILLLSNKITNFIAFVRIVTFRKIAKILLISIIEKNKKYLKKTSAKFIYVLKTKDNQKKFSIIYSCENMINGVEQHKFNIIIDFLMYIQDYISMKMHLNNIEEKDIIQNIKIKEEENSSDETNSYNKTCVSSMPTNELVDYAFNFYNIENEAKKLKNKSEKEILKKIENENEKENEESIKNEIIENDNIKNKINEDTDKNEEKEIIYEDNTKNKMKLNDNIKKRKDNKKNKKELVINKETKDNKNNKNEKELEKEKEKEKEKLVHILKNNFILIDENIEEKDLKLIEKILLKSNKSISINGLIKLYNDTLDDKRKLKNISNMIKNKVDNYKCDIAKELTIEEILENYKLKFDKNFILYNKNINIKNHYRFDTYYRKIIKVDEVKNINLNIMKEDIKKLSGNDLIDIISEDQVKFENDLEIEDF